MGGEHACPVCSATFTRPQHVTRHMRSHTGDRPYKCTHCGDQFARSDLLSRHVNKCHSNPVTSTSAAPRVGGRRAINRAATSKQACDQCVQSLLACDGANPCNKCVSRKVGCTWDKYGRVTRPAGPGHAPPTPKAQSLSGGMDWMGDLSFIPPAVYGDEQLYGGFSFPVYPPSEPYAHSSRSIPYSQSQPHYVPSQSHSQTQPNPFNYHRRLSSTSTCSSASSTHDSISSASSSNINLPLHQEAKLPHPPYPETFGLMSLNESAFHEPIPSGKSFNYHNLKTPSARDRHSEEKNSESDYWKSYLTSPPQSPPTAGFSGLPLQTPRRQRSLPSLKTPGPPILAPDKDETDPEDLKSYEAAVLARTPIGLNLAIPKRRKGCAEQGSAGGSGKTESSLAGALDGESPRGFPPHASSSFIPPAVPSSPHFSTYPSSAAKPGFKRLASSALEPESAKRFHFGNGNGHSIGYMRDGSEETEDSTSSYSGREGSAERGAV